MDKVTINKPMLTVGEFDTHTVQGYIETLSNMTMMFGPQQHIVIKINSMGGSAWGLLDLLDFIGTLPNPIITYVPGLAASAGAILFTCAAKKGSRIIGEHGKLMIHELQCGTMGDINDNNDMNKFDNDLNDSIMTLLAKSCGLETRKDIKSLISANADGKNLWMNSKKAIELGFADEIASVTMIPHSGFEVLVVKDEPKVEPVVKKTIKKTKKKL